MNRFLVQLFLLLIIVHLKNGDIIKHDANFYVSKANSVDICSNEIEWSCIPIATYNLNEILYVEKSK